MTRTHNIPQIIHQIIGPNTTPLIQRCIRSWWKLTSSGFEIKVWNDVTIGNFLLSEYPFAFEAFSKSRNHAEASDIARYLIVYHYGGIYTDWDIELLDPELFLDIIEKFPNGYILVDPLNNTLSSEYFCSIPNDKYLLNLTKDIVDLYNNGERASLFTPQYSGPYRMRDSLIKHGPTGMHSVPVKEVFAYDFTEIKSLARPPIAHRPLIHYWVHSWL